MVKKIFLKGFTRNIIFLVSILAAVTASSQTTVSQNTALDISAAFGTVISITSSNLVLYEFNFEEKKDVNQLYFISENVELDNIKSLKEIKKGNEISIEYKEEDSRRIITYINKYKGEKSAPLSLIPTQAES